MDRQKVIELAREAGLAYGSDEKPLSSVERFAALIEREVRGDAEPVLWLYDFFVDGEEFCNWSTKSLEEVGACHNVRPLYLHPAPAVDAEPVAWMSPKKERLEFSRADTVYGSHTIPLYTHPATAASAESVASVHIKDGCLIGSQRKSGVDIPDGQYALYPIGTFPAPAVNVEPVARLRFYKGEVVVTKDYETVERNGEFDVYTHPTPAVARQLVDGLAGLIDFIEIDNLKIDQDALRIARASLATAKAHGVWRP